MVVICLLCLFCGGLSLRRNPVLRRHLLLSSFEWRDLLLLVAGVNLTGNSMTPLPGRGRIPLIYYFRSQRFDVLLYYDVAIYDLSANIDYAAPSPSPLCSTCLDAISCSDLQGSLLQHIPSSHVDICSEDASEHLSLETSLMTTVSSTWTHAIFHLFTRLPLGKTGRSVVAQVMEHYLHHAPGIRRVTIKWQFSETFPLKLSAPGFASKKRTENDFSTGMFYCMGSSPIASDHQSSFPIQSQANFASFSFHTILM